MILPSPDPLVEKHALPPDKAGDVAPRRDDRADDTLDPDLTIPPEWTTRAGRRGFREKFAAGLRGLKHAMRGDSSFFAHAYRGLLITLTAALLGVGPTAWCLLLFAVTLVLVAELAHSAIDTLARSLGDPDEIGLTAAREIATAGVLVAVTTMAIVAVIVISLRLGELLGW